MLRAGNTMEQAQFQDGDIINYRGVLQLVSRNEEAVIYSDYDEENDSIVAELDVDFTHYRFSRFPATDDLMFSKGVKLDPEDKVKVHEVVLPSTDAMNKFSEERFIPIGAHTLPFVVLRADIITDAGFMVHDTETIGHSMANGQFYPVADNPVMYRHDMHGHAIGIGSLDATLMDTLVALHLHAIGLDDDTSTNIVLPKTLANFLAQALDYYTFHTHFESHMRPEIDDRDEILSYFVECLNRTPQIKKNKPLLEDLLGIISAYGYAVSTDTAKEKVTRPQDIIEYYKELDEVLQRR